MLKAQVRLKLISDNTNFEFLIAISNSDSTLNVDSVMAFALVEELNSIIKYCELKKIITQEELSEEAKILSSFHDILLKSAYVEKINCRVNYKDIRESLITFNLLSQEIKVSYSKLKEFALTLHACSLEVKMRDFAKEKMEEVGVDVDEIFNSLTGLDWDEVTEEEDEE